MDTIVKTYKVMGALIILCLLGGCAGGTQGVDPVVRENISPLSLPWPPSEQNLRQVSDDMIVVPAAEVSSSGGHTIPNSYPPGSLFMDRPNPLAWALYSLGGFSDETRLDTVELNFSWWPDADESTQLYVAVANYSKRNWDWYIAEAPQFELNLGGEAAYISPANSAHIAVVMYGAGPCLLENIVFSRVGDTSLMPPNGLEVTAILRSVSLEWEAAPNAETYHVYRDTHKSLSAPVWLTEDAPVSDLSYTDDTVERGVMYYYFIRSVQGITTSPPGDYVDIFSPEHHSDIPFNLASYTHGPKNFNVAWSYPGQFPVNYIIYYSNEKDFNLTDDAPNVLEVPGWNYIAQLGVVDYSEPIWWRICVQNGINRGSMTDDIPGVFQSAWEWGAAETIGEGDAPYSLIEVEGDYSLAYHNQNELNFARRTIGEWVSENISMPVLVTGSVSMDYSSGEYVIGTQSQLSEDAWGVFGQPDSWNAQRIHGDGVSGMVPHPNSGRNIKAVALESEVAIIHSGQEEINGIPYVFVHTKPIGGETWADPNLIWRANLTQDHMSPAIKDDNLFLLWFDTSDGELLIADRDNDWNQFNVLYSETEGYGNFNNLTWFNDEWWTTAYHPYSKQMLIIHGLDTAWHKSLNRDAGQVGEWAVMKAMDTGLVCAYFNRDLENWEMSIFDGTNWDTQLLYLDQVVFNRVDICSIGDLPYIVVNDTVDGTLKGFRMIPTE